MDILVDRDQEHQGLMSFDKASFNAQSGESLRPQQRSNVLGEQLFLLVKFSRSKDSQERDYSSTTELVLNWWIAFCLITSDSITQSEARCLQRALSKRCVPGLRILSNS